MLSRVTPTSTSVEDSSEKTRPFSYPCPPSSDSQPSTLTAMMTVDMVRAERVQSSQEPPQSVHEISKHAYKFPTYMMDHHNVAAAAASNRSSAFRTTQTLLACTQSLPLQQEYDNSTWRMYNRIQGSRVVNQECLAGDLKAGTVLAKESSHHDWSEEFALDDDDAIFVLEL